MTPTHDDLAHRIAGYGYTAIGLAHSIGIEHSSFFGHVYFLMGLIFLLGARR